jgi:hypothetical protein
MFIIAIFFLLALFFNPEDYLNEYCQMNPIMHTYQDNQGKLFSLWIGFVALMFGVCLLFATKNAMPEIDKSVGVIASSLECVFSGACGEMICEAFFKSLLIIFQVFLCMAGLALITTFGDMDGSSISINGHEIEGMEVKFQWYWYWWPCVAFYVFMCWWLFEFAIARYQFAISYAVCQWYWVLPVEEKGKDIVQDISTAKHVDVAAVGLDSVHGLRQGIKVKGASSKHEVAVLPVGRRGPGQKDVEGLMPKQVIFPQTFTVKHMVRNSVCKGNEVALVYHTGTLALGALVIPFTRLFRLFSMMIRALCGRSDKRSSYDEEDQTMKGAMTQLFQLLAGLIENVFGGISKNAYCDTILSTHEFWTATKEAKGMIEDAGGVIAFMHGSTALYEIIGVITITSICTAVCNILLKKWTFLGVRFTDPHNQFYVDDTYDVTLLAAVIAGVISYAFMSLFNITVDTLLYTFSWARRMRIKDYSTGKNVNTVVLPPSLMSMLEKEMEGDPDQLGALQPAGNKMNPFGGAHFGHAVTKLTSTVMGTAREQSPLLSTSPYAN